MLSSLNSLLFINHDVIMPMNKLPTAACLPNAEYFSRFCIVVFAAGGTQIPEKQSALEHNGRPSGRRQ